MGRVSRHRDRRARLDRHPVLRRDAPLGIRLQRRRVQDHGARALRGPGAVLPVLRRGGGARARRGDPHPPAPAQPDAGGARALSRDARPSHRVSGAAAPSRRRDRRRAPGRGRRAAGAGDGGPALGAALWRAAELGEAKNERFPVPFLGPGYGGPAIDAALAAYRDRVDVTRFATLGEACAEAARLIAAGRVVAWYRGRMEFGPRALGHRSILADPGHPEMRDRINAMVKMREAFRPFAPAVSLEQVD